MAPMTRFRSDPVTAVPGPDVIAYYAQRASAGLITDYPFLDGIPEEGAAS